ncbi:MAG: hypothetical protein COV99_01560 [Bacteroidetes bacterium CG12_big_fil_rev_8_21_14_0_65_60_17]|nr:MAG: hypothetical protein COV99_01560 [Bacteroidetes bacterium CG12_big_fil_rev_8_21_14_0_65_60_17]
MGLRILFCLQGEGRGHMTQAIALAGLLRDAGHEVVATLVGHAENGTVPAFLGERLMCPMHAYESPDIKLNADARAINVWRTTLSASRLSLRYLKGIRSIDDHLEAYRPDVMVNFYEPLAGLRRNSTVPMVAIAHQHMFHHSRYPFTAGSRLQRQGILMFTKLTAIRAARLLGLSLYDAPDMPQINLQVVPPILRREFFGLKPRRTEPPYLLVYLWRPELVGEIREWCEERPRSLVHCFLSHPQKKRDDQVLDNLVLHHLDDRLFLEKMAACSGIATTAGFETTAEAMYLGKPLLMVPTHVEQQCNAMDATLLGGGYASGTFDLERLEHFAPRDQSTFKAWVDRAPEIFVQALEEVAAGVPLTDRPPGPTPTHPTRRDGGHRTHPQSPVDGVQKFVQAAT